MHSLQLDEIYGEQGSEVGEVEQDRDCEPVADDEPLDTALIDKFDTEHHHQAVEDDHPLQEGRTP